MRIVVAGGTGTVGRYVVAEARARGHEVTTLTRSSGVDLVSGAGLDRNLIGADVVIDVAKMMTMSAAKARTWFETVTGNLTRAEQQAGVGHHVALSIVGIDSIDGSYFAGKLAQERAVERGGVPYTIARAGQFHEFTGQMLAQMGGPIAVIPTMLIRPVAAREVAEHLVGIAEGAPRTRAADLVGPRDERLADLARRQLGHDGVRRRVLEMRLPGAYGKGIASGSLHGTSGRREAKTSFDEWLDGDHRRITLDGHP